METRRTLYIADFCLSPQERIPHSGILCENKKILAIGGISAFSREPDVKIMDLTGNYAVPGFIDTHTHGAGGFDSSTAFAKGADIERMCRVLAYHGTTSFMPTMVSSRHDTMLAGVSALVGMIAGAHDGAEPIGIHLEGPFLNPEKHGSQNINDIIGKIDLGMLDELIEEGKGKIKIMTFAPELEGCEKLIEKLLENNITPSMGHSLANEEQVLKAVEVGAQRCTHLFNGMPELHQRRAALTTVALTDDRITIEMILDGFHLHPRMVDLACRAKPKENLIGVSDSIQAAGLKDGTYHIGTEEVSVKDGKSLTPEGVIAGTTLTLEEGWHHLVTYSHLTFTEAAACFTINPARNIGLDNIGELRPGKQADIAFFDSKTNRTRLTVSRGRIVYDSEETKKSKAEQKN